MLALDPKYLTKLNNLKVSIQNAEELTTYLEEEEEELYLPLKDKYEPEIEKIYNEVATTDPLQLINLEKELLDSGYEGLFLPRVIGYAVMRGQINENVKYVKPQEHFKNVLLALCNSANFDVLRGRSGKTIEIGFALSSDIWITNLVNAVSNKKVRQYLESLKLTQYRDVRSRLTSYTKYKRQFAHFNYLTADLPKQCSDLTLNGKSLIDFLIFRATSGLDNSNIKGFISDIIGSDLTGCPEFLKLLMTIGLYYDLDASDKKLFDSQWEKVKAQNKFEESVFSEIISIQEIDRNISGDAFGRLKSTLSSSKGEFIDYLALMHKVEEEGYINEETAELVRTYTNNHEGLSVQNEAARTFIQNKFKTFISKLAVEDFQEYFNLNPVFVNYMNIFSNEKFNQGIKVELLRYIKKLLRVNVDKRSKNYQDIKKFVQHSFVDMGFMKEKDVKELFKSKRKPKTA